MGGGLNGLGQVAFPFNAKVMAIGPETTKRKAMLVICNLKQMNGGLRVGQVAANVLQVIGEFVGTGCTAAVGS